MVLDEKMQIMRLGEAEIIHSTDDSHLREMRWPVR